MPKSRIWCTCHKRWTAWSTVYYIQLEDDLLAFNTQLKLHRVYVLLKVPCEVVLSFTALEGSALPFAWIWRLANYLSCTVFFLAICAADEDEIPAARIVRLLAGFWIVTVVGGWLGVLLPDGSIPSLTERVLPASVASNDFVQVLVRPEFAQVHDILGYPLGRPKAPFVYTNDWGSAYALLLPFFFLSWLQSADARRRSWAYLLLVASLIPVFVSLNRGLWLSMGVAMIYAGHRCGHQLRVDQPIGACARPDHFAVARQQRRRDQRQHHGWQPDRARDRRDPGSQGARGAGRDAGGVQPALSDRIAGPGAEGRDNGGR